MLVGQPCAGLINCEAEELSASISNLVLLVFKVMFAASHTSKNFRKLSSSPSIEFSYPNQSST
jgi:hypothetical protein